MNLSSHLNGLGFLPFRKDFVMGVLTRVTGTDFLIHTLMVMILDNESLITPKRVRVLCLIRKDFVMGVLTRVTRTDFLIHTLMVMILDNESLITPKRVRVFAF
jgi:hypothetical protein